MMQNFPVVRVCDSIAYMQENFQAAAQVGFIVVPIRGGRFNVFAERLPVHELHAKMQLAALIAIKPVDRNDGGMVQLCRHFRLGDK